jgi:hypothetical protein
VHESDNLQAPLFAGTGYYECVSGVVQGWRFKLIDYR